VLAVPASPETPEGRARPSATLRKAVDHNDSRIVLAGDDINGDGRPSRADELRAAMVHSSQLGSLPDPEPVIDGVLYQDTLAWLHGKPASGKTFVALDWACCVSTGLPWQGHGVTRGLVVYVMAEGVAGLRQRVEAWEDHAECGSDVLFLPRAVRLQRAADRTFLGAVAEELRPALLILDTQARVAVGWDENSAKDMGELVAVLDWLRALSGGCVLTVHHQRRDGDNMRGSTALEGAAATMVKVTRDGPNLRVDCDRQKDVADFDPVRLALVPRLESLVCKSQTGVGLSAELTGAEQKIMATMRDLFGTNGASGTVLRDSVGLTRTTYYRALNQLVSAGQLVNEGTPRRQHYMLPAPAAAAKSHVVPSSPMGLPDT
jgi:hypothetical protein